MLQLQITMLLNVIVLAEAGKEAEKGQSSDFQRAEE